MSVTLKTNVTIFIANPGPRDIRGEPSYLEAEPTPAFWMDRETIVEGENGQSRKARVYFMIQGGGSFQMGALVYPPHVEPSPANRNQALEVIRKQLSPDLNDETRSIVEFWA